MSSLVTKKINNLLAFKMLMPIFTIVSVEWRDVLNACDIQLIMGKDFGDDETLKTPGSPNHTFTVSTKDLLDLRSLKQHLN